MVFYSAPQLDARQPHATHAGRQPAEGEVAYERGARLRGRAARLRAARHKYVFFRGERELRPHGARRRVISPRRREFPPMGAAYNERLAADASHLFGKNCAPEGVLRQPVGKRLA